MAKLGRDGGNVPQSGSVVVTDEKQQRHEHTLEWIAAGLVAFFIFAGVVFYSFSVDVKSVSASPVGKSATHHRL
jgi:hypothetical protein